MLRAYGSALDGSPNHKTLWVLLRTPPPPETLAEMKGKAATEFDRGTLARMVRRCW